MKKLNTFILSIIICCICSSYTNVFSQVPATPTINSSKGTTLCNGDNALLTATSVGATDYLWSTGATTQSITINATGTYIVTAINTDGNSAPGQLTIISSDYAQQSVCLGGTNEDYGYCLQLTSDGGSIIAGSSNSNSGNVTGNYGGNDFWVVKLDSNQNIQWQKSLGGSRSDVARSIQQSADGGYIVAGSTNSNDGDVTGYHGGTDYWIVKIDNSGTIQWQKCLGGSVSDIANAIQQTIDGGYIIAGSTNSNDGDVTGNHGLNDCWIVKLDDIGNIEWQKCLGGTESEKAKSIQQTQDGGYIVAGYTLSNNGDVTGNHGLNDYWLVKLNSIGNIQWQKCLGGTIDDQANSIQQTNDGGYIVAGFTKSNDGDVMGFHAFRDYWIVKVNNSGNIQWQKCFGGSYFDEAKSIIQTIDGGYAVAGYTKSKDGDVDGNHSSNNLNYGTDAWVIKLNNSGDMEWQKCLGGSVFDVAYSIRQTSNGNYIIGGYTESNNLEVAGNHGAIDFWVVRFGPTGACPVPSTGFTVTNITTTSAKLNWDIVSCAEQYTVRYRATGFYTWHFKRVSANVGYQMITGLTHGFNYEWMVKTICSVGSGNSTSYYGVTNHFTAASSREGETLENTISGCHLSPNPTNGNFTLSFTADHGLKGSIEIYNTLGKLIYERKIEITESENSINLDINNAVAGIYFVNIKTDNGVYRQKLVKD